MRPGERLRGLVPARGLGPVRGLRAARGLVVAALGAALGAVLLAALLAGCGPRDRPDDLLVVYSAGPRGLAEAVTEAFAEEHGVRVEFFAATTGQVMARLEAERHRPRADVVVFASRVAADALKEAGRLRSYPNPHGVDRTRRSWHDPDGYFHATSAAWVGMAIREAAWDPEAHAELEWSDVFLGRFPGRVTLPGPSRSGAAGDFIVARTLDLGEPAWDEYREARRAGLDISAANSQAIGGLLVGAYDVIVGAVDYLILARIEDGAPIRFHAPPSGAALVERPVAILDHTPVPELAEAFVDFYLSPEMQARVAAVHLIPVHLDVPPSEIRARHIPVEPRAIPVDPAEALAEQTRILRRFQLQVERAEVIR